METQGPVELPLRDGRPIVIRPIRPDDAPRLVEHVQRVSEESRRRRFFSRLRRLDPRIAHRLANVDFNVRAAFVACYPGEDTVRATGRYERTSDAEAEVAFLVEDALQGQGVGRLLLHALVDHACRHEIRRLVAVVLAENGAMLHVLRTAGYPASFLYEYETVTVTLDLGAACAGCGAA